MRNATYTIEEQGCERRRVRGNWNISPLWEGKILLGLLRQQGLAGKGLVSAFERWAPRMVGTSRAEVNKAYNKQTGRELSDYILLQQADKAVRYRQLPPEAEGVRLELTKCVTSQNSEDDMFASGARKLSPELRAARASSENAVFAKTPESLAARPDLIGSRLSNALLSTNELADLIGFAPKTIRRWASRRLLNFIRVGNQFRFRPAAVELFLAQREIRK